MSRLWSIAVWLLLCLSSTFVLSSNSLWADEFTFVNETGVTETVAAQLLATEDDLLVLELADGRYRIIPNSVVKERKPQEGPTPLTTQQMADELQQKYGADLFRYSIRGQYLIGLVLETPLPKTSEGKVKQILARGTNFLKQVESAFGQFMKDAKLKVEPPQFPLVCLVFETDQMFEKYTNEVTGGRGLSAANISGFYSGLSNQLAIRLSECTSFTVPFHEAIHQQVYNRGIIQRLAPIPKWFDEGIATGFEANNGKTTALPNKVSPRYAAQALQRNQFSWQEMHREDEFFNGDVLASEAYGQAWGLHWLLITKYRSEYNKYLQILAGKRPLQVESEGDREAEFRSCFSKSLNELEAEFPNVLRSAIQRQKVPVELPKPPGLSVTEDSLGKVEFSAISNGEVVRFEGRLQNLSPLRPMVFHVLVLTDGGTYADWFVDALDSSKAAALPAQVAIKPIANARVTGGGSAFRVKIRSTTPDSATAQAWRSGQLPTPLLETRRPRDNDD